MHRSAIAAETDEICFQRQKKIPLMRLRMRNACTVGFQYPSGLERHKKTKKHALLAAICDGSSQPFAAYSDGAEFSQVVITQPWVIIENLTKG